MTNSLAGAPTNASTGSAGCLRCHSSISPCSVLEGQIGSPWQMISTIRRAVGPVRVLQHWQGRPSTSERIGPAASPPPLRQPPASSRMPASRPALQPPLARSAHRLCLLSRRSAPGQDHRVPLPGLRGVVLRQLLGADDAPRGLRVRQPVHRVRGPGGRRLRGRHRPGAPLRRPPPLRAPRALQLHPREEASGGSCPAAASGGVLLVLR